MLTCSGYHEDTYDPRTLSKNVARMAKKLASLHKKLDFDAIAFRGTSGAAVAYPLSVLHGYHLICVRKSKSHHGNKVEASRDGIMKYLIVDDFVCSGKTVKAIVKAINGQHRFSTAPECVGVLVHYDNDRTQVAVSRKQIVPVFKAPKR